jgi:uncharacterized membrane-anchored protein
MSDYLGQKSVPVAGVVGVFGLAYALRLQLRACEYRATVYWSTVMMWPCSGDGRGRSRAGASLNYTVTTPLFAAVVAGVFFAWWRSEGTLSIHSITTRRRELYYWAAVLATFALGTAAGDLTAIQLNLGFFDSAILFGVAIAIPALAWWRGLLNPIAAFWAAYVVTRPLGASFADGFSKPHGQTGLGLGDGLVSVVALAVFIALVAYVAMAKNDIQAQAGVPLAAEG